jgi:CHAT domain-containing protein
LVIKCIEKTTIRANVPLALPKEAAPDAFGGTKALPTSFVAPPRTIRDLTVILDSEKPNLKKIAERKTAASMNPPVGGSPSELARFYYDRGNARAELGRLKESIDDANKAIEVARGKVDGGTMGRLQQFAAVQYFLAGYHKQALAVALDQARINSTKGGRGHLFATYRMISNLLTMLGDIPGAEAYQRRSLALIQTARTSASWQAIYAKWGQTWECDVEWTRGRISEMHGHYREAYTSYRIAEQRRRAALKMLVSAGRESVPEARNLQSIHLMILDQARMKAKEGLLVEAEIDGRRALLDALKNQGKYHPGTPMYIIGLANILVEQGRYEEAEKLARISIDITREIGVAEDSHDTAGRLSTLGNILMLQGKSTEAATIYAEVDKAIAKWEPQRRQLLETHDSRISTLYLTGQVETGLAAAHVLLKQEIARVGEKHLDAALARGTVAIGYTLTGKEADAIREFKAAIPILIPALRESADVDNTSVVLTRTRRLQHIAEAYIGLLANKPNNSDDLAIETFQLADSIRSQSVQQALSASSARMVAKDPALAALIRTEQDLAKQINAQLGVLNNALALPSSERDEAGVRAISATIDNARSERAKARSEIARRFPSYTDLIDPKAPTVEQIKDTLRSGEAFVSFYFGREKSFVWAVPKQGSVAFAPIATTAVELESRVRKLRAALEPRSVRTVYDIPPFDLALAYDLYRLLLEPVEAGWKSTNSLIVATNGALGLLPLSLLPTAPTAVTGREDVAFANYRSVPWLARMHAVTLVPSAAALRTLRQLPPGSDKREPLIGFGDPFFTAAQAAEDQEQRPRGLRIEIAAVSDRDAPIRRRAAVETRQIDTADLARLPRLPDTADELKSIALSLHVDPTKTLYLGRQANERVVKTTDLSRFRVVAFATHGLMPGDLNGLTQPALALSTPTVADVDGDGLLTMEEVLALKLDADWVILSACNTGTGAEAGAEAVSGLGRAFFYAGSRALLVTNWAVMSDAATALTSDIFRRQAEYPKLPRAEALRQAMLGLIDGPGYIYGGKTVYSYAHPLFWAPYSIIGDGGAK